MKWIERKRDEWINACMNAWLTKWKPGYTKRKERQRLNARTIAWKNATKSSKMKWNPRTWNERTWSEMQWMKDWMWRNEGMKKERKEGINEWRSEWVMNANMSERKKEWINEWKNEEMNQSINEPMNQWINECVHEWKWNWKWTWKKKRMQQWNNECTCCRPDLPEISELLSFWTLILALSNANSGYGNCERRLSVTLASFERRLSPFTGWNVYSV